MIVKSTGVVTFRDKNGLFQKREWPVYPHFLGSCMRKLLRRLCIQQVTIGDKMKVLKKKDIDIFKMACRLKANMT